MAVTVTGQLGDDSYTPEGRDRPVTRHRLEAADIAVSLRWATATVTRQTSNGNGSRNGQAPDAAQPTEPADSAESAEDEAGS